MTEDLKRNVYCILGLPIDVIEMPAVVQQIDNAAHSRNALFISTPNLDFLVQSRFDRAFREALLDSDLSPVDGMPVLMIARLIGVPIKLRVSGADIFEALKAREHFGRRLGVFLFGGSDAASTAACKRLNENPSGLKCVGALNPGFGDVAALSRDALIDAVNSSNADFLLVALGAKKGQPWLHSNHKRLSVPVRAHLGAAINFQAGTIKRAPPGFRALGMEWLWRIKEEPHLWRRYGQGGCVLAFLLLTRVLPLVVLNGWNRYRSKRQPRPLWLESAAQHDFVTIRLYGDAIEQFASKASARLEETLTAPCKNVVIDLSAVRAIDARFFGLLLMLRKRLKSQGCGLQFVGASLAIKRLFRLNEVQFLL